MLHTRTEYVFMYLLGGVIMREILFKAKEIDNGEWVEGGLLQNDDDYYIVPEFGFSCIDEYSNISRATVQVFKVDKKTICQYTGLCDKNDKKIWENDIIKTYGFNNMLKSVSKIVWRDSLFAGWHYKIIKSYKMQLEGYDVLATGRKDALKCEVIGNIFDNSELLGV